jgi:hypothetical protein
MPFWSLLHITYGGRQVFAAIGMKAIHVQPIFRRFNITLRLSWWSGRHRRSAWSAFARPLTLIQRASLIHRLLLYKYAGFEDLLRDLPSTTAWSWVQRVRQQSNAHHRRRHEQEYSKHPLFNSSPMMSVENTALSRLQIYVIPLRWRAPWSETVPPDSMHTAETSS